MQTYITVNNTTTFSSVTPIIATATGKQKLEHVLAQNNGKYLLEDLTDEYIKSADYDGMFSKASKNGKKILFLITGKECDAVKYMHHGWGSKFAPTRHIDRVPQKITENSNSVIAKLLKRTQIQ